MSMYTKQPFTLPKFAEILKQREKHFQVKVTETFETVARSIINDKTRDSLQIRDGKVALAVRDRFIEAGWPAVLAEKLADDGSSTPYKVWEITFTGL